MVVSKERVTAITGRMALERRSARIDARFRAVRFGLSIAFTVLLLSLFSLAYVTPQDAAFYPLMMALGGTVLLFAVVWMVGRRTRREYYEVLREAAALKAEEEAQ